MTDDRRALIRELRWLLRIVRKQRGLMLTLGVSGLPLVDTVSSGQAYLGTVPKTVYEKLGGQLQQLTAGDLPPLLSADRAGGAK